MSCIEGTTDLLTFTFLLLHGTQPDRVFLCVFRGAACMIVVFETRIYMTVRDFGGSCRMRCDWQTPSGVWLPTSAAIRMRMREDVAAEAQPRKAHMTRPREKLAPRHEMDLTEPSGHPWMRVMLREWCRTGS